MRATIEFTFFAIVLLCPSDSQASILRRAIFNGNYEPSPPASEGPPAALNAIRDPKYLPVQLGILLGSYVLFTAAVATVILFLRSRNRKILVIQTKNDIELLEQQKETAHQNFSVPLSPRNFSHPGIDPKGPTPYVFPSTQSWEQTSPISPVGSDPNVDQIIVQQDRARLGQGLEDIYAHVMEQEEAKLAGIDISELPIPQPQPSANWVPQTPISSQRTTLTKGKRPSNIEMGERSSRTSSIISSLMSPGRKKKERGMVISSPMPTPLRSSFAHDSDREPLSPRYNKPPPPIPTDQEPYRPSHSRAGSTGTGFSNSTDPSPISPAQSVADHLRPYNRSQIAFSPPNESTHMGHQYNKSQTSISTNHSSDRRGTPLLSNPSGLPSSPRSGLPASPRGTPAPLKLATISQVELSKPDPKVGNTQRALPFRAFEPPPGLASPSLNNPLAAPTTKTTVLERAAHPALLSPGLKTPWTAGAVPYSPYQPFSPLMPVTPRLVTKEDRKRERKEEKRRMGGLKSPVMEMVGDEGDAWGSGY